MYLLFRKLE